MNKITIMTILGTRPEIIKLSETIKRLDRHTNHILVHTGQNYDYELNEIFFKDMDLRKPDIALNVIKASPAAMIGDIITKSDQIMEKINPDAILIYGDTNSCLSVIAAKKRKIPIFHMEAGNRCFDQRVPEEINRKIVDHLSDINMPLSEHARNYLILEGIRPETIIKIGSPMKEVLDANMDGILKSNILEREQLTKNQYIIISLHREENVDYDKNLNHLLETIDSISKIYQIPIMISTHPRTHKKLRGGGGQMNYATNNKLVRFSKPYGFHDYNKLQLNAFCVISDSGTITEESSILNLPAITIRNAHERPEGMDEGVLIMTGIDKDRIIESIEVVVNNRQERRGTNLVKDYDVNHVSQKVLNIILSYTGYINRVVWKK